MRIIYQVGSYTATTTDKKTAVITFPLAYVWMCRCRQTRFVQPEDVVNNTIPDETTA